MAFAATEFLLEITMTTSTIQTTVDLKDALLNDAMTLQSLYAEFAQEERQLAEAGLASYAQMVDEEERSGEAEQRVRDCG